METKRINTALASYIDRSISIKYSVRILCLLFSLSLYSLSVALDMPGRLAQKTIGIFIDFQFEDLEVMYPKIRLEEEGANVVVIGAHPAGMKYAGKHGYPCKSNKQVDDMAADGADLDGLVLPGGFAPDYMRRSPRMLSIISGMVAAQKPVAAICHG